MADFDSIEDVSAQPSVNTPKSFDAIEDHSPKSFDDIEEAGPKSKYETPGQQLLTGVEGAGQGIAGPIATGIELGAHKLGLDEMAGIDTSAEAQAGRKEANPIIHGVTEAGALAGSMMTGIGEAGLISKGASKLLPEATSVLGKIGSAAIKNAIESGGIQAGDEISKAMLGQGDPEAPVSSALAHIGAAGLFGAGIGGTFNAAGQGLTAIENAKIGTKATNLLAGMGAAAKAHAAGIPEKEAKEFITKYFQDFGAGDLFKYNEYKPGIDLYYSGVRKAVNKATDAVVDTAAGVAGAQALGPVGGAMAVGLSQKYIAPVIEKVLNKPLVGVTNKLALPTVMYALSKGQTSGLFNALNHAAQVSKGAKAVANGVESILKSGGQQSINAIASDRDKQKIIDYIDNGGIGKEMEESLQPSSTEGQTGYAEGGAISTDNGSIASLYPTQDMMMNQAKGRISNYLNSIKPQPHQSKLPFDHKPDTRDADKTYNNAIEIAAAPLSVLNHVKDGTIQADQIKHFTSLYPELHSHLSKKLTEGVMNAQLDEEKMPYKTRQALSLFMGVALDSTMTPGSIMAAQTAFAPKQSPEPPPPKKSKSSNTNKLGKEAKSYKTVDQAAESDRSSRD